MSYRSITCQQLVELVTLYLDVLTPADRAAVSDHLLACPDCSHYLTQMRQLVQLSSELVQPDHSHETLPAGLHTELLHAFHRHTTPPD